MPRTRDLVSPPVWLIVPFGELILRIAYRPSEVTPAFHRAVSAAMSDDERLHDLPVLLSRLLDAWDLLDDDEQPVAITPETLADVPISVLGRIMAAIATDLTVSTATREALCQSRSRR